MKAVIRNFDLISNCCGARELPEAVKCGSEWHGRCSKCKENATFEEVSHEEEEV